VLPQALPEQVLRAVEPVPVVRPTPDGGGSPSSVVDLLVTAGWSWTRSLIGEGWPERTPVRRALPKTGSSASQSRSSAVMP
jgi:hypothetical protein